MATTSAKWIHMVGIGGAGMSGIARVLKEQGYKVSGSDLQCNGVSNRLKEIGIEINEGHSSSNVKEGVDLLVISSAIPKDNIEVQEAQKRQIPVIKRGQMLASIVNSQKGIAVAGAHGKTTTTSMLYMVLEECGVDPSFIAGGEIQGNLSNAKLGKGDYFVVEADESDASFLELQPYVAVVTNIENDHLDFYKSVDRIKKAFTQFLIQVNPAGFAVLYGDDPRIKEIVQKINTKTILYGEDENNDYYFTDWTPKGMGSCFELYNRSGHVGTVQLSVPGKHNAINATATVAAAMELGQDFEKICQALKKFAGAIRRFQVLGSVNGVTVVDDYAHHPTEIMATIDAALETDHGRVVVVFQPHRYTRTQLLAEQFGQAFKKADVVFVTDVYSAGESPIPGVNGELVFDEALKAGCQVRYIPCLKDVPRSLIGELKDKDLLITMGAGDVWKIGYDMVGKVPQ